MKRKLLSGITMLSLSFWFTLAAFAAGGPRINPLPEGLAAHYPPKAEGPVYLFQMLDLERAFSGIAAELTEDDVAGARDQYRQFVAKYRATKGLVAEWQEAFPEAEVESLGRALHGEDRGAAFRALEGVGAICHQCHVDTMVSTQQKYRWGDFSALAVDDSRSGQPKPYAVFKKFLASNMAGIDVDAGQGQWANARTHFALLRHRFEALSETCRACHAEKPGYLANVKALGLLEEEMGKAAPDKDRVSGLLKSLGGEACAGCHLIHVPAAMRTAAVR